MAQFLDKNHGKADEDVAEDTDDHDDQEQQDWPVKRGGGSRRRRVAGPWINGGGNQVDGAAVARSDCRCLKGPTSQEAGQRLTDRRRRRC